MSDMLHITLYYDPQTVLSGFITVHITVSQFSDKEFELREGKKIYTQSFTTAQSGTRI